MYSISVQRYMEERCFGEKRGEGSGGFLYFPEEEDIHGDDMLKEGAESGEGRFS